MNKKLHIALIFGGKSVEHEVSIRSAKSIYSAINKEKYQISLIGIDKSGYWQVLDQIPNGEIKSKIKNNNGFLDPNCGKALAESDVIFPVLHGLFGEDGTVQGFLKLMNKPFVGAGVLGSALGMDKEVQKRLLHEVGIKTAKFLAFRRPDSHSELREESLEILHSVQNDADSPVKNKLNFNDIKNQLGLPLFVKPANSGSSVGTSKVKSEAEFLPAISNAFKYDSKILIEEFIEGREIECSVLGNNNPIASIPGEIIPKHEFYSYEAKYLDNDGATLKIPAELDKSVIKKIQEIAVKTFQSLECAGMARVDFFVRLKSKQAFNLVDNRISDDRRVYDFRKKNLDKGWEIIVNEINTIPGFTSISMYPKLWEASGINYSDLINKLITLALEKFEKEKKLKTTI